MRVYDLATIRPSDIPLSEPKPRRVAPTLSACREALLRAGYVPALLDDSGRAHAKALAESACPNCERVGLDLYLYCWADGTRVGVGACPDCGHAGEV